MGKSKLDEAQKLAHVRREIITNCESLPDLIRVHGSTSIGHVALALGKCFLWVGPTLDEYSLTQPLPGIAPLPRVQDLGERLRVIGLEFLNAPSEGELKRTIEVLKKQVAVLTQLAKIQAEGAR